MTKQTPELHTVVLNVRADNDTYSAMTVRVLNAVAELDDIPVTLATTELGGGHLRHVEGSSVRIIDPSRIQGLASRVKNNCDVLLVDVPVDPNNLDASSTLMDDFRVEAKASGLRLKVFTMEGGTLLQSPLADERGLVLGRGLVNVIRAFDFDAMLLQIENRIRCVDCRPDDFLDQPGKPILAYLDDVYAEGDIFGDWLQCHLKYTRKSSIVRSILDRP